MKKLMIEIKLTTVDFIPTWWFEEDGRAGVKTTPIGQIAYDAVDLTPEIYEAMRIIATVAWRAYLKERGIEGDQ